MQRENVNIFWFRRDLRLEDNTGLYHALTDNLPVLPIFIFDPDILNKLSDKKDARVQFIYQQVEKLKEKLRAHGSDLFVYYSKPIEVYKNLIEKFHIHNIYVNKDYEPYAKERDQKIKELCSIKGIILKDYKDQVIFEQLEIAKEDGKPYKVYTPYQREWKETLDQMGISVVESANYLSNFVKLSSSEFPTLQEIGFQKNTLHYPELKFDHAIIARYHENRNFPAIDSTSKLGIHLRHGTISIRKAVKVAQEQNEVWLNQLIWREFYMMILDNFPFVVDKEFNSRYSKIPWRTNEEEYSKWCDGITGYPIVDAGMRELNTTGYMHNRVRMITASFLTKHLLIDWRWGEAYFAEKLLDFELANNNGGWQWAAGCGTDAQPYFRVFNPYEQAKKFDPDMAYIKKWVPEINTKDYPHPIIDHTFARKRAIQTFKESLQ